MEERRGSELPSASSGEVPSPPVSHRGFGDSILSPDTTTDTVTEAAQGLSEYSASSPVKNREGSSIKALRPTPLGTSP